MIGKKTGIVIIIMPKGSSMHPNISKTAWIIAIISHFDTAESLTALLIISEAPAASTTRLNALAAITIHMIITVILVVSWRAFLIIDILNFLYMTAEIRAPKAPTAAASVGVAMPA